jgi:pyruvate/2-oxoglutarate dehydrogenase complex dihydrolipoamide dehydrogenase (E3) component
MRRCTPSGSWWPPEATRSSRPSTACAALGLEAAGVEVGERGITVDGRCRAAEGIWAVGDVTGVMPFTHVAKYQARVACNDIIGQDARADYRAVPRVVFCDPEVAAVGLTAEQARGRGTDVTSARIHLLATVRYVPAQFPTFSEAYLTAVEPLSPT